MMRRLLLGAAAAVGAQPPCEGTLCFLRPRLYLWTMMASTPSTLTLVRHWVRHYAALGFDPAHMHAVVDDSPGVDALRRALHDLGVSVDDADVGYSSSERTRRLNDWLAALPVDAWAAAPDVDEFSSSAPS